MNDPSYESPKLTVLGEVSELTEGQKTGGTADQAGLDGTSSFTPPPSDIRLKCDIGGI